MTWGMLELVSDADLLLAGASGDKSAFGPLFARHEKYLYAVALRTTGDPEDAADALQDAYLSIMRTAVGFRADASVQCWMHRIVVNAAFDRIRRRKHHDTRPLPESDDSLAERGDDDFTETVDLRLSIGRALDVLPADQRAAIIAIDFEGRSVGETARALGVAPGTVKSRCHRGRHKLALVLGHLRELD